MSSAAASSEYWQGVECRTCHEEVVNQFAGSRHGRAMEFGGWGEVSCQSCHGDASAHVASADPETIKNPAKLPDRQVADTCLSCHASGGHQQLWLGSVHDTSSVTCLDCHSVHHFKSSEKLLVKATDTEVCFTCHAEVRKAQYQRSTHLIRNEWGASRMGCVSCHQPHGSGGEKLLKEVSVNETCYQCHTEKRGPFLWEHPPAREDCLNCHKVHGSNNPALLTQRSTFLCQSCHLQGRHQTVAGRPNSTWLVNRQCLNCHPMIHGSNHPSGILYHR
jgi:DmsE family decaheme c-type cytochrome